MSAYTVVASQVLKARYDQSSYWSGKWQNSIRANDLVQARIASILRPGTVYNMDGRFGYRNIGTYPAGQDRGILELDGMGFRLPTMAWEEKTIPYGDYLKPAAWFRKDWTVTQLHQVGLNIKYVSLLGKARRLFTQLAQDLKWIPGAVISKWDRAMGAGGLPMMRSVSYFRSVGEYPSFLNTDGRRAAWEQIRLSIAPIQQEVSAANVAILEQEAERLEANTDFWNQVARWSGVDAVEKAFRDLKTKVIEFNKNQIVADDSIQRMQSMMLTDPQAFTIEDQQAFDDIKQRATTQQAGAKAALDGPIMQALTSDGMGIGIAPVVLIAIGSAIVIGATVTLTTFVVMSEGTKRLAMELEAALIERRDVFDTSVFTTQAANIDSRIEDLRAQLDSGQISQDSYNAQVATLESQRRESHVDLMRRRDQTQAQADTLAENARKTMETGFVSALSNIKGLVMWGALAAVSIMVVPRLLKKKG